MRQAGEAGQRVVARQPVQVAQRHLGPGQTEVAHDLVLRLADARRRVGRLKVRDDLAEGYVVAGQIASGFHDGGSHVAAGAQRVEHRAEPARDRRTPSGQILAPGQMGEMHCCHLPRLMRRASPPGHDAVSGQKSTKSPPR